MARNEKLGGPQDETQRTRRSFLRGVAALGGLAASGGLAVAQPPKQMPVRRTKGSTKRDVVSRGRLQLVRSTRPKARIAPLMRPPAGRDIADPLDRRALRREISRRPGGNALVDSAAKSQRVAEDEEPPPPPTDETVEGLSLLDAFLVGLRLTPTDCLCGEEPYRFDESRWPLYLTSYCGRLTSMGVRNGWCLVDTGLTPEADQELMRITIATPGTPDEVFPYSLELNLWSPYLSYLDRIQFLMDETPLGLSETRSGTLTTIVELSGSAGTDARHALQVCATGDTTRRIGLGLYWANIMAL